jgi:hypothetical protein
MSLPSVTNSSMPKHNCLPVTGTAPAPRCYPEWRDSESEEGALGISASADKLLSEA